MGERGDVSERRVTMRIPIRLMSEANQREHWRVKAKRVAQHRAIGRIGLGPKVKGQPWIATRPVLVTITRIGPRKLDDDNLASSAKALRDGIADAMQVDDGDARITWRYDQATGRTYAVDVEIIEAPSRQGGPSKIVARAKKAIE